MIAVVEGALVVIRARAAARWVSDQSLPGTVRLLPGGAARNVAANLVRLGPVMATSSAKITRLGAVLDGASVLVCNQEEALALTGLSDGVAWEVLGAAECRLR